jgi:hypothetical protein
MRAISASIAFAILFLTTPAFAIDDPDELVRSLYRLQTVPAGKKAIDAYFAADTAKALKADYKAGEVGAIDFDYRYDGQDFEIADLKIGKGVDEAGGARVAATFTNFGKPASVVYRLCVAKAGWRIADVANADGRWALRKMLNLREPVRC